VHINQRFEPIGGHIVERRVADDAGVVDDDSTRPQVVIAVSMIACPPSGLVTLWVSAMA
jgi:hypothetical protein